MIFGHIISVGVNILSGKDIFKGEKHEGSIS